MTIRGEVYKAHKDLRELDGALTVRDALLDEYLRLSEKAQDAYDKEQMEKFRGGY